MYHRLKQNFSKNQRKIREKLVKSTTKKFWTWKTGYVDMYINCWKSMLVIKFLKIRKNKK